ncbi:MAG: hypothetical protein RR060_06485 [Victivallaceae bacterium]
MLFFCGGIANEIEDNSVLHAQTAVNNAFHRLNFNADTAKAPATDAHSITSGSISVELNAILCESKSSGNAINSERSGSGGSYSNDKKSKLTKIFSKYTVHREVLICLFLLLVLLPNIKIFRFNYLNQYASQLFLRPRPVRAGPAFV